MKLTSHQIMVRASGLAAVLLSSLVFAGCEHTAPLQHHVFQSEPAKVVQHANLSDMMANYTYANPHTGHLWGSDGFDLESDTGRGHIDNQDTTFIINGAEVEIPVNSSADSDIVHKISPNGSDTKVVSDYDKNSDQSDSDGPEVDCHFGNKTLTFKAGNLPSDEAKKTLVYAKYQLHDIKHVSSTDSNKKFHYEIELVLYPLKYKRNNGLGMHTIPKWQRAHYALYLIRNKPLYHHKGRYSPSHNDGRLPY